MPPYLKPTLNNDLNPWKKIDNNFVECTNGTFTSFYVINPSELSSDSDSDILIKMNGLASLIMAFNSNELIVGFFSFSTHFEFDDKIKFFTEQKNNNVYMNKLTELYAKKFKEISEFSSLKKRKYVMYFHGQSKKTIYQMIRKIEPSLLEAGMHIIPADRNDIFLIFNKLFHLGEDNATFNIKNLEIGFKKLGFQINRKDANGKLLEKKLCKILNVSQVSKSPLPPFWLDALFNSGDWITSIEFDSLNEKERNSFIEGLSADFVNVRQYKSRVKNLEVENNRNITNTIINDLSKQSQDIKLSKLLIYLSANNKLELRKKHTDIKNILNRLGFSFTNINFRQQEAFLNIQPFELSKEIDKDIEIVLTTDAIGLSYPFTQTYYMDIDGSYIGLNYNGSPLILDICNRQKRASGNTVILGTTGSRKSTLIKMLILGFFYQKNVKQTLVLDWQNEYTQLAHNFDQLVLNFTKSASDSSPHINLFQIPKMYKSHQIDATISEINLSNKERYQEHIQYLIGALSSLLLQESESISTRQFTILTDEIHKLYQDFGIKSNNDFDALSNEKWPTIDDLRLKLMKSYKNNFKGKKQELNDFNRDIYKFFIDALSTWCEDGAYDGIFNKHTNILLDDKYKLIIFNMFGLKTEGGLGNIQKVMTLAVLKYFDGTMYDHRRNYPRENDPNATYKNFIVDEFHLIVDENDPNALISFASKYQTVRKFYCNMCVATPSLSTFVHAQNQAIVKGLQNILDNSVFKFFLSMSDDELQQVNAKMFTSENKLSQSEINFLSHFDNENNAGKFILSISMFGRVQGQIDSGKNIKREDFNTSVDKITEFAQLWGTPPVRYSTASVQDISHKTSGEKKAH